MNNKKEEEKLYKNQQGEHKKYAGEMKDYAIASNRSIQKIKKKKNSINVEEVLSHERNAERRSRQGFQSCY